MDYVVVIGKYDNTIDWETTLVKVLNSLEYRPIVLCGREDFDYITERIAQRLHLTTKVIPLDWNRYGRNYIPFRNVEFFDYRPKAVYLFYNGLPSKEIVDLKVQARGFNVPLYINGEPLHFDSTNITEALLNKDVETYLELINNFSTTNV